MLSELVGTESRFFLVLRMKIHAPDAIKSRNMIPPVIPPKRLSMCPRWAAEEDAGSLDIVVDGNSPIVGLGTELADMDFRTTND